MYRCYLIYRISALSWVPCFLWSPVFRWKSRSENYLGYVGGLVMSSKWGIWVILIIKPLDALMSQIYFWNKILHVSDISSVHHQEFFTLHTAMAYVIEVLWQLGSVLILLASCQQTCMTYTIAVCTVKNSWWWKEELYETCGFLFRKQIWEISASSWFYYKNLSRWTVTWT